ncbi:hypothetical protein VTL71DRAFT_16367 [Oculimacula yallundae]|uniref:Heterokaryon incompatibility domain-containing protein n=1 Tax=Oculimacula yallundae TaxID=86028 RepID=A0ABR4CGG9_9HELO
MPRGSNENVAETASTAFTTPENSRFYSKKLYSMLDPKRLEIRLLQLHPQRLKPTDLQTVFPQWIRPGTDAYRLQEPSLRPLIMSQRLAESVDLPSSVTERIRTKACKQLIKPLPKGWKPVSFNSHLKECKYSDDVCLSLKANIPDILYFVNCYTGKSQWEVPTQDAPEVPPDMTKTFLACELHDKVLLTTMSGKYAALSYCAGSSKETIKIMIDGMWFNAFANLEHSLESFREHSQQARGSETKMLIWTDQVCIHQINHIEKSCQVALMRQIYSQAEHVYVCLSTASSTPALLKSATEGIATLRRVFQGSHLSTFPELRTTAQIQKALLNHFTNLLGVEAELPQVAMWFDFLLNVVSVPWWSRAWVYQEFIVASRAYFLCGSHCLSWPEISPHLTFFCSTLSNEVDDSKFTDTSFRDSGETCKTEEATTLETAHFFAQHISKPSNDTKAHRDRVSYFVKSKSEWTGVHSLRLILERASFFHSTDPRDLVYAFVGLVEPSEMVRPDYSKENNICHVLIAAAERLVASEHKLTILDDAIMRDRHGERMRLPSWVPDYTSRITSNSDLIKELIDGPGKRFLASGDSQAQASVVRFEGNLANAKLKVRGRRIDRLASILSDEYGLSCTFMTLSGLKVLTTSNARVGDTLWILFGGKAVYLLRQQYEDYFLVSAASLYEEVDHAKWVPSNIMYGKLMNQAGVVDESISII